jgi:hypothetical protein
MSLPAFAGTWTCDTGLDGKLIFHMSAKGDELARYIVGYEDPRSKTRLRILLGETSPNVYRAYTLLVNMPIKQELEGICTFAP